MQIGFLVETLMTPLEAAQEGLFTCMNAQVRLKIEIEREFLPTELTLIRLLPCMNKHVPLELSVIQELLPTAVMRTLELQIMSL